MERGEIMSRQKLFPSREEKKAEEIFPSSYSRTCTCGRERKGARGKRRNGGRGGIGRRISSSRQKNFCREREEKRARES